jgi:4-aminobutyrate aminotransferase/(S)-3-amino-2-methylpropionate transaminase
LPALRTLCDQHGILLIADEIQTGLGRTGRMWATEHTHVEPDLLITAKSLAAGLPLSAVVGRQDVFERVPPRAIGGTYVGNPVACAAALAVLDVIEDERLIERAQRIGAEIRQRFTEYAARHAIVGDVRGLGAMMAIELVKNRHTKEPAREAARAAISHALAEGVLILGAGTHGNVIRVLVPLVISHGDLDQALGVIDRAVAAATR